MVTDNLSDALAELRRMADPEGLATATLEATAEAMVEYDRETVSGELHRGGWYNRSGDLEDGYDTTDVTRSGSTFSVDEVNTAPHAVHVEAIDGKSVMTAADSGAWEGMLQAAFQDAARRAEGSTR
jgi:hypothetical protein